MRAYYSQSHLVAASQTKQISLPFNGLYHSYLGELLDIELEYYSEQANDFIHSLDLKKYNKALTDGYAQHLIDAINEYHGLSIKISNADYEPMNGRNTGDALWCDIDVTTLPAIPLADLQPYATDSLTSYSGFSSFYDPNLQHLKGAKLENWSDVYITFIIEYLVDKYLANDIGGAHDIEQSYIDELGSNGGAIELLLNSITDEQCEQLNALLYKDQ